MNILDQIIEHKITEVANRKEPLSGKIIGAKHLFWYPASFLKKIYSAGR